MITRYAVAFAAALFLVACGGGGGNQPIVMEPDPVTDPDPAEPGPDPEPDPEPVTPEPDPEPDPEIPPEPVEPEPEPEPEAVRLPFPYQSAGHYRTDSLPTPTAADARHMPIYQDNERTYVGVDQGPNFYDTFTVGNSIARVAHNPADWLPVVGERGDVEIRHGRIGDGVGGNVVAPYPSEAIRSFTALDGPPPTVRIIGTASADDIARTIRAVQILNASLPESYKLRISTQLPDLSLRNNLMPGDAYHLSGEELPNTIHVEWIPAAEYGALTGKGQSGAFGAYFGPDNGGGGYVGLNMGAGAYPRDNETIVVLMHELMHALADFGHVSSRYATILEASSTGRYIEQDGVRQPLSLLFPVDREALQGFFGRLGGADPANLGTWLATTMRVDGNGPHANFGVALRNDYAEPWAYGPTPATDLANNRSLSGSVTWEGALLGLTPQAAAVTGDAEIGVNLASMTGRADFTNLEAWAANTAPGAEGTGTQWLDGDLGYAITVRGNTFRETGGDTGRLTGIFTGQSHEGAAGALDRSDLTAAFGASR